MRIRDALTLAVAVVLPGCGGSEPTTSTPTAVSLRLHYQAPDPASLPPVRVEELAGCSHHYAPGNLAVSTSWGAEGRFALLASGVYELTLPAAPVNQDLWIAFVDITLCARTDSVYVTRGVSANEVPLSRVEAPEGIPHLAFRLDGAGRVLP